MGVGVRIRGFVVGRGSRRMAKAILLQIREVAQAVLPLGSVDSATMNSLLEQFSGWQ